MFVEHILQAGKQQNLRERKEIFTSDPPGHNRRYCSPAHPLPCASTDYSQSYHWEVKKTSSEYLPLRIVCVSLGIGRPFLFTAIGSLLLSQGGEEEVSPRTWCAATPRPCLVICWRIHVDVSFSRLL